jgi:glycerol uptake facilitator-like aquaporin
MRPAGIMGFPGTSKCIEHKAPVQHIARSIVDNFIIEFIATLMVYITVVLFGASDDDMRFAPSIANGLIILCLKDEDLFFPDGSATVSVILYFLGAYNTPELLSRLFGQICALAVAFAFFIGAPSPPIHDIPLKSVFFYEAMGTIMEHLTIIYFVVPMLCNAATSHGSSAPGVARRKHELVGPPNGVVAHTAVVVAVLHYVLQRGLKAEMNPMATLLLTMLSMLPLNHAFMALAGQCTGVIVAGMYLYAFAPRVRTK